jgi:hypothetical protein
VVDKNNSVFKGCCKNGKVSKNLFNIQKMAAPIGCIGIKADGDICGKRCRNNATRCATHLKTIETNGPNYLHIKELGYIHKREIRDIEMRYDAAIDAAQNPIERRNLAEDLLHEIHLIRVQHNRVITQVVRRQQDEIRETGVDPDAEARARNAERLRQRNAAMQIRRELVVDQARQRVIAANNAVEQQAAPRGGELGNFARDAQNVHTSVAVKQTKDMVSNILKIVVPSEFKWNARTCSKTPGEIITECGLSAKGAWQMVAKYCQDEDVYDMGRGIYGKTLDGVWQYVRNSSDKADLCRILRQEMEDNIGMCAQGNLTRLCNILSGYMEGIGVQESPSEILGRKLPLLMEIEDETTRLNEAYKLLVDTGIPEEQWLSWVEPLVDGSPRLKANAAGQVIGLEIA